MDLEAQLGEKIALVGGDDDDHCIGTGDTADAEFTVHSIVRPLIALSNIESRGSMFAGERVKPHFKVRFCSLAFGFEEHVSAMLYSVHA